MASVTIASRASPVLAGCPRAGKRLGKHLPSESQPDFDHEAKIFIVGHRAGLNGGVMN